MNEIESSRPVQTTKHISQSELVVNNKYVSFRSLFECHLRSILIHLHIGHSSTLTVEFIRLFFLPWPVSLRYTNERTKESRCLCMYVCVCQPFSCLSPSYEMNEWTNERSNERMKKAKMTFLLLLPLISSCSSMDDDMKTKPCFPFAIYRIESKRDEKTKDRHTHTLWLLLCMMW